MHPIPPPALAGLLLVLCLVAGACGDGGKDELTSFLWTARGEGQAYLLGTIHVAHPELDLLVDGLADELDEADAVYTEIPFEPWVQDQILALSKLPVGQTLEGLLESGLYTRLSSYLANKGLSVALLADTKIWVVAISLEALGTDLVGLAGLTLDEQVYRYAKKQGRTVGGLETVEEQMAVFDDLSVAEQSLMLERTLDALERVSFAAMDPLLQLYLDGDAEEMADAILSGYKDNDSLDTKIKERLITRRNQIMASRMTGHMQAMPSNSFFFAVGVGHLVGEGNAVELLSQAGYQTQRQLSARQQTITLDRQALAQAGPRSLARLPASSRLLLRRLAQEQPGN